LESPRNGGINGYSTFEHGLLQGEPSIITSKWGSWHPNGGFITQDTQINTIIISVLRQKRVNCVGRCWPRGRRCVWYVCVQGRHLKGKLALIKFVNIAPTI
jgi:hypothetical protein